MRQLHLFDEPPSADASASAPAPPERLRRGTWPRADVADPAAQLRQRLDRLLDGRLRSLTLTDNRSRIVSARDTTGGLEVRIHRSFVHASQATLARVVEFLNGARGSRRQRALEEIREHFELHRQPQSRKPRRISIEPQGRRFDLAEIRDELNRRYFGSALDVEITWGRTPKKRRGRRRRGFSLRLGSYHDPERLIRIHRSLDRPGVPRYVVESIVYHEMLHAAVPPVVRPGRRRQLHPPEFRRRERQFPHYEAAESWLAKNLGRLAGVE